MRQLSHELLPGTNRRENQEFETNVPAAHGSTAALSANIIQHERQSLILNNLSLTGNKRPFGLASIICSSAGVLWFVVCFAAKEAKWWSSLWLFLLIFAFSISLGLIGRKSIGGILGIIVGGL